MTDIQVRFWANETEKFKARESERHNMETEAELKRHNMLSEQLQGEANALERARQQIEREKLSVQRWISSLQHAENVRHNQALESIQSSYNQQRYDVDMGNLSESIRSHTAQEEISRKKNQINELDAYNRYYETQLKKPVYASQVFGNILNPMANVGNTVSRFLGVGNDAAKSIISLFGLG